MLLTLVGFQVLVAAMYTPTALSRLRHGEISVLVFSAVVLSGILLAIGGVMFMRSTRAAAYCFFASAVFGGIAYWQWRPTFVFCGLLIAICAGLMSVVIVRRPAKV